MLFSSYISFRALTLCPNQSLLEIPVLLYVNYLWIACFWNFFVSILCESLVFESVPSWQRCVNCFVLKFLLWPFRCESHCFWNYFVITMCESHDDGRYRVGCFYLVRVWDSRGPIPFSGTSGTQPSLNMSRWRKSRRSSKGGRHAVGFPPPRRWGGMYRQEKQPRFRFPIHTISLYFLRHPTFSWIFCVGLGRSLVMTTRSTMATVSLWILLAQYFLKNGSPLTLSPKNDKRRLEWTPFSFSKSEYFVFT